MKRIFTLFLITISYLTQAQTTYYVAATGGDDANSGKEESPWATLAYAVTQASVHDTIFLKAGTHNINSQVSVPVGIHIKGAGPTSIISSGVTDQWKATLLLHSASEGTDGNQSISYIKMDGNETAWGAIQVNARSNVIIHHCTFVDFFSCGVIFNASTAYYGPPEIRATGNKYFNNISNNCSDYPLADDGQGHVMFGGQDGIEIFNNTMTQTSRELKRNGYLIKFYSYGYSRAFKIYNNTLNRAIGSQGYPYYDFSIETWHTEGGAEIYNNVMTGGIDVGGGITYNCLVTGDYDYGIWIHDNIIGPEEYAGSETTGIYLECNTDGAIIERNYFKNQYNGIMVTPGSGQTCQNHTIRYNSFSGVRSYGIRFINGVNGGFANNIDIYNNVFVAGSTSLVGIGLLSVGTTTDLNVINNIVVGFDYAAMFANGASGQTIDGLNIQNNILYDNASSNEPVLSNITPTNYVNSDNIIDDPQFFSSENFHFMEDSPGIGAGKHIDNPILLDGSLLDLDKVAVGNPPNIGCYETIANLASPEYINAVIENDDPTLIIISYSMGLTQVVPDKSAFEVRVNSIVVSIESIDIVGGNVHITLSNPVSVEDLVTISYYVPTENPLQSIFNVSAEAISNGNVENNVMTEGPEKLDPNLLIINPNPVKDHFKLSSAEDVPETASIFRITDQAGLIVYKKPYTSEMMSNTININLSPGLYFAQILSNVAILLVGKFIVM
jgi:hypothetical protein